MACQPWPFFFGKMAKGFRAKDVPVIDISVLSKDL